MASLPKNSGPGEVLLVAAHGVGGRQHAAGRLRRGADVADGDLIAALQQIGPAVRDIFHLLFIDDEGDGAGVSQRPVAVFVFRPVRHLIR